MKCECCNEGKCKACLHYKSVVKIINTIDLLNIVDPATFVRTQTNSTFEITPEECTILERMKTSKNDTEYKEYMLNPQLYIKRDTKSVVHINCPNCNIKIDISLTPINKQDQCCSQNIIEKNHDERCMYSVWY
jgi:hypothetical protein